MEAGKADFKLIRGKRVFYICRYRKYYVAMDRGRTNETHH